MFRVTRVTLSPGGPDSGGATLVAFCNIEIAGAIEITEVRALRARGRRFVAMPNRRARARCPQCDRWIGWGDWYCHRCGAELRGTWPAQPDKGKVFEDVCFPLNPAARAKVEAAVWRAVEAAEARARTANHPANHPAA